MLLGNALSLSLSLSPISVPGFGRNYDGFVLSSCLANNSAAILPVVEFGVNGDAREELAQTEEPNSSREANSIPDYTSAEDATVPVTEATQEPGEPRYSRRLQGQKPV
jgi:hypothetical protein